MKAYISRRLRRLMSALFISAAVCTTALVAGCGGGSGGGNSPPAPPPVQARAAPLQFGYFGTGENQVAETFDHVTYVFAADWGDWDTMAPDITLRIIAQLQDAKARGIKSAWVGVGYLMWGDHFVLRPDGVARLRAFRTQLQALGLFDMVKVLYPIDEPDVNGMSDAMLTPILRTIRTEWGAPVLLAVTYGDTSSYAGHDEYDLLSKDKYGDGAGVLNELPPLNKGQRHFLTPGGASCLSNHGPDDPQPFYDYAQQHADVFGIMAFLWVDGPTACMKGIRNNGMAPAYRAVGQQIKATQ